MVSVSRRALPPHRGHVALTKLGHLGQRGAALAADLHVAGQHHREVLLPLRHHAVLLAVEHRDRRAPVALAG